jgi:hypothetical protein
MSITAPWQQVVNLVELQLLDSCWQPIGDTFLCAATVLLHSKVSKHAAAVLSVGVHCSHVGGYLR